MKHILIFYFICIGFTNSNKIIYAQNFNSKKLELKPIQPPEIKTLEVNSNEVLLEFEKNDSCIVQILRYRLIGNEDWSEVNFRGVNAIISNLMTDEKYEIMITAVYPNSTSYPLGICFITKN